MTNSQSGDCHMELQRIRTRDGFTLHGIDNMVDSSVMVAHIHGKCGNFYQNYFVAYMARELSSAGIGFCAFNHRAHDCLVENNVAGHVVYSGAAVEEIGEVRRDIRAIHNYARRRSNRVILQGHSQGCEYVFWHAMELQKPPELILLSPSDSRAIQEKWLNGESLDSQLQRIKSRYHLRGREWLPDNEYGVRGKPEYEIPVVAKTLADLLASEQLSTFSFDREWGRSSIPTRCFAYVGGSDPLRMHALEDTEAGLRRRIGYLDFFSLPGGDHHFTGHEPLVTQRIVDWIENGGVADA
jgi:hypothetical protein